MNTIISNKEEKIFIQIEIIKNTIEMFKTAFFMKGSTEAELALNALLQQTEKLELIIINSISSNE